MGDLCERLSSGRLNKCSSARLPLHRHQPFPNTTPTRHNWCRFGMVCIGALQLAWLWKNCGARHSGWNDQLSHQSLLVCAAIVLLGGRLQAGAFCFYNVIAQLLIWTKSSCCSLSRLNGQFDPIMSNWCLIGHYTHAHAHKHTHSFSSSCCSNLSQYQFHR